MKTRYIVLFGMIWLVTGLLLSAPILMPYLRGSIKVNATVQTHDTSRVAETETPRISGHPAHIEFPQRNISVGVAPGYFNPSSKSWTLSNDKAHFATVTPEPNNKTGNTFIYGHNIPEIFGRLTEAALGDTATITTTNGHTFTYKLVAIRDVDPNDTSAIQDHKAPILTVQTCSGLWFENRRMFTFELSEAR